MIKANVILDHYKWKKKIKNPNNYFKKKIRKLNKLESFNEKKHQFSVLLTSNKKNSASHAILRKCDFEDYPEIELRALLNILYLRFPCRLTQMYQTLRFC